MKTKHTGDEYKAALEKVGMTVTVEVNGGLAIYNGEMKTSLGQLIVHCGEHGTANIVKLWVTTPSRRSKWVYDKTPAQIADQIQKIKDFMP